MYSITNMNVVNKGGMGQGLPANREVQHYQCPSNLPMRRCALSGTFPFIINPRWIMYTMDLSLVGLSSQSCGELPGLHQAHYGLQAKGFCNFPSGAMRREQQCRRGRRTCRSIRTCASSGGGPSFGLLLECDGVLVDTHNDGHRVAFNRAFSVDYSYLCS